jgi:hypothetical protein
MRIGFAAAAALTLALVAWYLRADATRMPVTHAAVTPEPTRRSEFPPANVAAPRESPVRHAPDVLPARKRPDYSGRYRHAADLLTFIEALAPLAADGDVDAQYYLAVASRRCVREYATLFGPAGREKSLEAALEADYWTRYYEPVARRIYAQCARFKAAPDNPFTEWQDLLEAASEAGSGSAKALLVFEMSQGMIRMHDLSERDQRKLDIRVLAKEAIRTKEPEVLYHLAYVESITGRSGTPEDVGTIWMLAACQRGMACGSDTEQFQFFCRWDPQCQQSETMVDLFRRREGARFEDVERRAREINENLDADRFDEILP